MANAGARTHSSPHFITEKIKGLSQTTPLTLSLSTSTLFARSRRGSATLNAIPEQLDYEWKWLIKPSHSEPALMIAYLHGATRCAVRVT